MHKEMIYTPVDKNGYPDAFLICKESTCDEASAAYTFWAIGIDTLEYHNKLQGWELDLELAKVYYEYLDEYFEYDVLGVNQ